jgi:hypothetical protein
VLFRVKLSPMFCFFFSFMQTSLSNISTSFAHGPPQPSA